MARSLLDMYLSPFGGSSGNFATKGCLRRRESLIGCRGGRKGGQVEFTLRADGTGGRDGPQRGIGQEAADELVLQGWSGFVVFEASNKREARRLTIHTTDHVFVPTTHRGDSTPTL